MSILWSVPNVEARGLGRCQISLRMKEVIVKDEVCDDDPDAKYLGSGLVFESDSMFSNGGTQLRCI